MGRACDSGLVGFGHVLSHRHRLMLLASEERHGIDVKCGRHRKNSSYLLECLCSALKRGCLGPSTSDAALFFCFGGADRSSQEPLGSNHRCDPFLRVTVPPCGRMGGEFQEALKGGIFRIYIYNRYHICPQSLANIRSLLQVQLFGSEKSSTH
jgi:hypothetical protein